MSRGNINPLVVLTGPLDGRDGVVTARDMALRGEEELQTQGDMMRTNFKELAE